MTTDRQVPVRWSPHADQIMHGALEVLEFQRRKTQDRVCDYGSFSVADSLADILDSTLFALDSAIQTVGDGDFTTGLERVRQSIIGTINHYANPENRPDE